MLFDGYVAVDWSASGKPTTGENSVWIAVWDSGETETQNPSTRRQAVNQIEQLLRTASKEQRRLLCCFDFPFGYPEGTAQKLTGQASWQAVWTRLSATIVDLPNNCNNRFEAAARLNDTFDGPGPFWGNPLKREIPGLDRTKPTYGWGVEHPWRQTERRPAQEVWKLNGRGSVGGQALTGIAALAELRDRGNAVSAKVWPFQTLGEGQHHVLAEIYPSQIDPEPGQEVKDERQVKAVVKALNRLDKQGELFQRLRLPSDKCPSVRREEGWILDIRPLKT